jgi:hypothetical protein
MANALTNIQLIDLAKRMQDTPLAGIFYKDELANETLEYNKGYVINLESETEPNSNGTHWTCFIVAKYLNNKKIGYYYDSYGVGPPKEVTRFCRGIELHYNKADHQSLMSSVCGFFCLAFLYFVTRCDLRSKDLLKDAKTFCDLFYDLNISNDFKHNEFVLEQFFKAEPSGRTVIKDE